MIYDLLEALLSFLDKLFDNLFPTNNKSKKKDYHYEKRQLMTRNEKYFYNILKELKNENYEILPQLNLATIANKITPTRYRNELFRNIDFAIFSKDYEEILLLIEINDKTHNYRSRRSRDRKVKNICEKIGVKLITFYTNYPNEKNYVLNRIKKELDVNKIQNIENTSPTLSDGQKDISE